MNTRMLLKNLRVEGVDLEAKGGRLHVDAPAGVLTDELKASLVESKPALVELLERERTKLEEAGRRGLLIRYSKAPGYIALHDPLTGEWHDFPESSCLPGVVESAKSANRERRAEKNGGAVRGSRGETMETVGLRGDRENPNYERSSMSEASGQQAQIDHFGGCPKCGGNDGCLNVGRSHWFVCRRHKVRWFVGANLFSNWRHEEDWEWEENAKELEGYEEAEPLMPEPSPEPTREESETELDDIFGW
ncbi:MAG: hypothetical protein M3494_02770 [Actinomycetota bacterium]|nr:hypothetical protein [Actinomycetota bacterium]